MKTLMIKKMLTVCLFATATLVSCKKNNDIAPQQQAPVVKTIEGSWVGKYGSGNGEPNEFFAFNIKPGGLLDVIDENNEVVGTGTWEMTENVFTGKYKYTGNFLGFSVAAKFNAETGKLTGSWGAGNNTDSGEFYMDKK
jgi:hypothetical protein